MRVVLPTSCAKQTTFLSDAGISFQGAAVPVVTNEQMQEEKGNVELITRALQD